MKPGSRSARSCGANAGGARAEGFRLMSAVHRQCRPAMVLVLQATCAGDRDGGDSAALQSDLAQIFQAMSRGLCRHQVAGAANRPLVILTSRGYPVV
jgi:hypothetical protein